MTIFVFCARTDSCSFWLSDPASFRARSFLSAPPWLAWRIFSAAWIVRLLRTSGGTCPICSSACCAPILTRPLISSAYCITICSRIFAWRTGITDCIIWFCPKEGSSINALLTAICALWSCCGKALIGNPWEANWISVIGSLGCGSGSWAKNLSGCWIFAAFRIDMCTCSMLYMPGGAWVANCNTIWAIAKRWAEEGTFGSETGIISIRPSKSCLRIFPCWFGRL